MLRKMIVPCLLLAVLASGVEAADKKKAMPREDVVEIPAIGQGLCVSNVFQTNMVVQRDKPLNVWGWAAAGEKVTVAFGPQKATTTAGADRAWKVTLKATGANAAPQTMTVSGAKKTLKLDNILVGDVWVLGGQSNMEFGLGSVDNGQLEVVSANFPQIRLLTMPQGKGFDSVGSFQRLHEWSSWSSRHFRKGDWDVCSPEIVREFSAIGYVFGRRLFMAARVPIGLIDTSIGGTTVETWTPEAVLQKIPGAETRDKLKEWADKIAAFDAKADLARQIANFQKRKKSFEEEGKPLPANLKPPTALRPGPVADRNRPGYCYAGVIKPLGGLAVAGAVFHQGYNNAFSGSAGARMYYQVFGKMITSWRQTFGDEAMPFCIISLCTAGAPQTRDNFVLPMYDAGVLLREAQYKTFVDFRDGGDKNIGFVSSFDQRKSNYHPQIKIPVGERTAKWALVTQYEIISGRDAEDYWLPPSIKEVKIADGKIQLTMSTTIKTKDDSDGELLGFAIAGDDRRFYPADAAWFTDGTKDNRNKLKYKRDVLVLSSPFVPAPKHYRHAWARNPLTNIVNNRGIPLATQRSDDWRLEETPIKLQAPKEDMDAKTLSRYVSGRIRKELALADTERRIKEAQATIAELKEQFEKDLADKKKKEAVEAERAAEDKAKAK